MPSSQPAPVTGERSRGNPCVHERGEVFIWRFRCRRRSGQELEHSRTERHTDPIGNKSASVRRGDADWDSVGRYTYSSRLEKRDSGLRQRPWIGRRVTVELCERG